MGGYSNFSFREIAKAVGVKSSSVHYHFPTKDDLGSAIVQRYTDRFMEALGDPTEFLNVDEGLSRYVGLYRDSLVKDELMCLCGIMGAEIEALPPSVGNEAKKFFERNIGWLITLLSNAEPSIAPDRLRSRSLHIISALEGAMILARSLEDNQIFDTVASEIL